MTRHRAAPPPHPANHRHVRAALAAASVVALAALTGCATADATATEPSTMPEPKPLSVSIPMPDLGPVPEPDPPLTEAESEAKRLEAADQQWAWLLQQWPGADRPADPFERYITDDQRVEVMTACFEAAGVPFERGYGSADFSGPVLSVGPQPVTEAQAVAGFACQEAHPVKITSRGANDAELRWIFDYLVEFTAPCYAANGYENPPPPTREEWVSKWPEYVWSPMPGDMMLEPEEQAALDEACPHVDETMQRLRAEQG